MGGGVRAGFAMAIALLGYLLSNALGAIPLEYFTTASCDADLITIVCRYPGGERWTPGVFESAVAISVIALAASWLWLRQNVTFPFIATIAAFALTTLAYDGFFAWPILQEGRIVNDTMNVLGFVMFASFFLTFCLLRRHAMPIGVVTTAVGVSFIAKIATMCVFSVLHAHMMGASELFFLFFLYAFGGFSVHLMAVSTIVANARPVAASTATNWTAAPLTRGGAVDGLRGVAILLVVVYHYVPAHFFSFSLGKPINSILFVVAGYFFAAALLKTSRPLNQSFANRLRATGDIFVRRHIRVWPMLAIIVALYASLGFAAPSALTRQIYETWPYYVTYLGYVPRWAYEAQTFPPHLWVVSAQESLIFVLCIVAVGFGVPALRRALWVLVCAGIAFRGIGTLLFFPDHMSMALETPLAVLDPLALGMLARFELDQRTMGSQLRRVLFVALIGAIALFAVLPNWNVTYFTLAPLISALMTALVMIVSSDNVRGAKLAAAGLAHPALVFIGRMSLSAFLLHPFVNTIIRLVYTRNFETEMAWWLLFAIGPVMSFALAWVFWRLFEEPLRQLKSRSVVAPRSGAATA